MAAVRLPAAAGPITGNDFTKGALLALFSGICSGFIPIFALYAYRGQASVLTFIFLRTLIGASVYFLYLWRKSLPVHLSCRQLGCLFVMGGVLDRKSVV